MAMLRMPKSWAPQAVDEATYYEASQYGRRRGLEEQGGSPRPVRARLETAPGYGPADEMVGGGTAPARQHVCAYATQRRRFIPDGAAMDQENRPPVQHSGKPRRASTGNFKPNGAPQTQQQATLIRPVYVQRGPMSPPASAAPSPAGVVGPARPASASVRAPSAAETVYDYTQRDGLPLLTVPGLRDAFPISGCPHQSSPPQPSRRMRSRDPHYAAAPMPPPRAGSEEVPHRSGGFEHALHEGQPGPPAHSRWRTARAQATGSVGPMRSSSADPQVPAPKLQASQDGGTGRLSQVTRESFMSGARSIIQRLQYGTGTEPIDDACLQSAEEQFQGRALGRALEKVVEHEMASVDSMLSLPEGCSVAEMEYKGHVAALLKLISKRALERSKRHILLAAPSRFSALASALQGDVQKGLRRVSEASSVPCATSTNVSASEIIAEGMQPSQSELALQELCAQLEQECVEADHRIEAVKEADTQVPTMPLAECAEMLLEVAQPLADDQALSGVEAKWQQLKRLMYADACSREVYDKLEDERRDVQARTEQLATCAFADLPFAGLNAPVALAGLQ
mmetsp:Transcript_8119/g.18092  ORF Transcript_8119/g.18092 Transcript_8119/m.18092 type:complete len:568 (-) Transcript_8119:142-1845(-)